MHHAHAHPSTSLQYPPAIHRTKKISSRNIVRNGVQKNHYSGQVLGVFFFFFTLNQLVVHFVPLKLKQIVPSKSSGSWVVFPRADAVPGV